jgi:cytochrome c-type protein NapC
VLPAPAALLLIVLLITIVLIGILVTVPGITAGRAGKILAFLALFVFPLIVAGFGASEHMERSKQTSFCLSCHVMEPYGRSLYVDDPSYLPAAHYQNNRVPRDEACYTCHTDYVLYGGIRAKMRGLHHLWVQYTSKPQPPLHLYQPYNNRECLHCHEGARSFEQGTTHNADPEILQQIRDNKFSCLTSGCHDMVHNVTQLQKVKYWKPEHSPSPPK